MHILIVDDEALCRKSLAYALRSDGYSIIEAESGEEALETIAQQRIDLILLDMQMPSMDGLDVLSTIKSDESYSDIPIVMVTSMNMDSTVAICLDKGAEDFVVKPVSPVVIRARVRGALRRSLPANGAAKTPSSRGRILGLIGAKGGVGTTTVAVNLGMGLAKTCKSVAIIDLNREYASVACQLGLLQSDAGHSEENGSGSHKTSPPFVEHKSGIQVLSCSLEEGRDTQSEGRLLEAVNWSRQRFDHTLIDFPNGTDPSCVELLPQCHTVLLAVEFEPTSLDAAIRREKLLLNAGVDESRMKVVAVNRACVTSSITLRDIRASLSCPVVGVIPSDPDAFTMANTLSTPITSCQHNSMASGALNALTERIKGK